METLMEKSGGKLNLFLKVTRRRPDRYHELETLFWPLATPADTITMECGGSPGIRVTSSLPGLPEDLENLAGRAALAYFEAAGLRTGVSIFIQKELPVAAGVGGGSSNAAAVLRMLNGRYHALSGSELAELALTLGADVPYFLAPRLALATGIGERFRYPAGRFSPPPLLLVNPNFPISAKWAYTHLDPADIGEETSGKLDRLLAALGTGDAAGVAANLHNDLAPALYAKFPLLTLLRDFMREHGALNAEVTGSGSSLFAVCPDVESRRKLAAALRSEFSPETIRLWENLPLSVIEQGPRS